MGLNETIIFIKVISAMALTLLIILRLATYLKLRKQKKETGAKYIIGFFHPFCDAGGGGEKVLF